jgi:elongation factor Tu
MDPCGLANSSLVAAILARQVCQQRDALGKRAPWSPASLQRLQSSLGSRGRLSTFVYDDQGRLIACIDSVGPLASDPHDRAVLIGANGAHDDGVTFSYCSPSLAALAGGTESLLAASVTPRRSVRAIRRAEYETARRRHFLFDCSAKVGFLRNMVAHGGPMDVVLLVIDARHDARKVAASMDRQFRQARQAGVPQVVVFLDQPGDIRSARLNLVEYRTRQRLSRHGFPGDEVPFLRGDSRRALEESDDDEGSWRCIDDLLDSLDAAIPEPPCAEDQPFLMHVDDVELLEDGGAVAMGRIERGACTAGDPVEVVGFDATPGKSTVRSVENLDQEHPHGTAGDRVQLFLERPDGGRIQRGQVLAAPGTAMAVFRFEAIVLALPPEEGGRNTPFLVGDRLRLHLRAGEVDGVVLHITASGRAASDRCLPGDNATMAFEMDPGSAAVLEPGLCFSILEEDRIVACGVVARGGRPGGGAA